LCAGSVGFVNTIRVLNPCLFRSETPLPPPPPPPPSQVMPTLPSLSEAGLREMRRLAFNVDACFLGAIIKDVPRDGS